MKLLNNMKRLLSESFTSEDDNKLTTAHEVALKNIIEIAKERIWLADPINTTEFDIDAFDEYLSDETIKRIKSSIKLMENYLANNSTD